MVDFIKYRQHVSHCRISLSLYRTKEQVKEQLTKLANDFDIDEIIVAAVTYSQEDKIRSFELLAEAFELQSQSSEVAL